MEDKVNFDEKFLKKIKAMNEKEREEFFLNLPREKSASYKEIFMRVIMLEDFYNIISSLPKESFKDIFSLSIKEVNANPADILKDYLVLEMDKFYELSNLEKNRFRLPKRPEHHIQLGLLRNNRIAHPMDRKKFISNEDVAKLYRDIDNIGFDKIIQEFKQYAQVCMDLVNKSEFYEQAIHNLKKLMEGDKIKLLDDADLKKSLRNVKIRNDGSVIESSIDGRIRALLLAIEASKKDDNLSSSNP